MKPGSDFLSLYLLSNDQVKDEKRPLKEVCVLLGINIYSAKTILYVHKKQGRIQKKKYRNRNRENIKSKINIKMALNNNLTIPDDKSKKMVFVNEDEELNDDIGIVFSFKIYKEKIEEEFQIHWKAKEIISKLIKSS